MNLSARQIESKTLGINKQGGKDVLLYNSCQDHNETSEKL